MNKRSISLGIAIVMLYMAVVASAVAAQVTIHVAILDDLANADPWYDLVSKFEAQHPDIKVELMLQFRENWDQLAVRLAGNVGPDIIAGYGVFSGHVMRNQALLDLTPYIVRDNQFELVEDFAPPALSTFIRDGRIYGFPKYSAVGGIYYNTDMFDQAGLAYPDPDWTWDDFYEISKRLTITDGNLITQYGYNLNNLWTWIYPWFYASGVDFSDPYQVPFDTPEAIRAGNFLQDMQRSGYLLWRFGQFSQRQAAMTSSGSWELTWITGEVPVGVTAMPIGPARRATQVNNDVVGINKNTKHPEESWAFLKWFYSEETQREYLRLFGLQPARLSLGTDWIEAVTDLIVAQGFPLPQGDIRLFFEATAYAEPEPMFANPQVVNDHIMRALQRVVLAGMPTESLFSDTARVATAALQAELNR